jgi:cyclin H
LQGLPDILVDDLKKAYDEGLNHVRAARLTDAELIYTPSQIALACFDMASPSLARAWIRSKQFSPPASPPGSEEDAMLAVLGPIKHMVSTQGHSPDVEGVREVDRRLKLCKNPEKVVGSNAYNKKLEEKQRKADEKRKRKADLARKAMAAGDPFGSELIEKESLQDDDDDDDDDD